MPSHTRRFLFVAFACATTVTHFTAKAGIDLTSFSATVLSGRSVRLDWSTASEFNNYGFFIQRSPVDSSQYQDIPGAFIPGNGTTTIPQNYSYTDTTVTGGIWFYRLKQMDLASGGLGGGVHYSFGVMAYVLPAPVLLQPGNGAAGIPPGISFRWSPVEGASHYRLQVALDSMFASVIVDDSVLTDTTVSVGSLVWGTTYFWRVASSNASHSSLFSAGYSFTTAMFSVGVSLVAGWNIISNPVSTPDDSLRSLFPSTVSPFAFSFNGLQGYIASHILERGKGYWAKFDTPHVTQVAGVEVEQDSVYVQTGWNIIGSISHPVETSAIVAIPPDLLLTPFYGYEGVLMVADTLQPGKGYWVKAGSDGILVLERSGIRLRSSRPVR